MSEPPQASEGDEGLGSTAPLDGLLADPLVWEEPPAWLEAQVLDAIGAEAAATVIAPGADVAAPAGPGGTGRTTTSARAEANRRWVRPFLVGAASAAAAPPRGGVAATGRPRPPTPTPGWPPGGRWRAARAAAAAVLVVVALTALTGEQTGRQGATEVALSGTELAPEASAVATLADTPLGTVIDLDVSGLEPAPDGAFYHAWLRQEGDAGEGVSAGTFHLRGGDGQIELWAGVSPEQYPVITVTLQREGEGPESSGEVVLRGRVG